MSAFDGTMPGDLVHAATGNEANSSRRSTKGAGWRVSDAQPYLVISHDVFNTRRMLVVGGRGQIGWISVHTVFGRQEFKKSS